MRDAPELAVQIVNYHTRSYLERCLASVAPDAQDSGLAYEINLLDNASGERLDELARGIPNCHAYESERNVGFGAGHNLLARETGAAHLLILNPDVEFVDDNTCRRLVEALGSGAGVRAVGPKLITPDGRAQRYDHGRLHGIRAQIALRGGHSYWRELNVRQDVAWVSGAALLVTRAAFIDVGGFDENLFLYKEDEDLCLRLRQAGGEILYVADVRIRHSGSVVAHRGEELGRASGYYFDKHFPNRRLQRAFAAVHQSLAYLHL